jgi:phage terminase small subunit
MAARTGGILTEKDKKFCREYIANGENGLQAAIAVGYSPGKGGHSAASQANVLLKKPYIREYLKAWREKYEFKTVVSVDKQLKRLEMITSVTIDMYLQFSKKGIASFKPMEEWTEAMKYAVEGYSYTASGRLILKLHGKSWAADMMNKHLGIYEKDNRQQSGVQIHLPGQAPVHLEKDQISAQSTIISGTGDDQG